MRIYPPVFVQDLGGENGRVYRSEREENAEEEAWKKQTELEYQKIVDQMLAEEEDEDEDEIMSGDDEDVESLYARWKKASDQAHYMASLTYSRRTELMLLVESRQASRRESIIKEASREMEETRPARKVSKNVKIRICDYPPRAGDRGRQGLVTLWQYDPELLGSIKEGKRFKVWLWD
jgi:hypothetical protein